MPKKDLDLEKVKGGNHITVKQFQKLPTKKQAEILKPFIEANSEQFAKIATVAIGASKLSQTFASSLQSTIRFPIKEIIESIKVPELPIPTVNNGIDARTFTFERYNPPVTISKSRSEIEKERREAYMTELQIQVLEQQLNLVKGIQTPQYDISTGHLSFMGKVIEIPLNTNLEMVCRIVLKNVRNMAKKWSWDEIVEEARESTDIFTSTQIYTAARAVNEKVAQEVQVKDFFVNKPIRTIRLNLKFVPK